jgi:hypothetical protein
MIVMANGDGWHRRHENRHGSLVHHGSSNML